MGLSERICFTKILDIHRTTLNDKLQHVVSVKFIIPAAGATSAGTIIAFNDFATRLSVVIYPPSLRGSIAGLELLC